MRLLLSLTGTAVQGPLTVFIFVGWHRSKHIKGTDALRWARVIYLACWAAEKERVLVGAAVDSYTV